MDLIFIQMDVIKVAWEPGMVPLMITFWTSCVLGWVRQCPCPQWLHVPEAHPLPHDRFVWGRQLSSTHTPIDLGAVVFNMQPPQVPREGGRVENHAGNFLPLAEPRSCGSNWTSSSAGKCSFCVLRRNGSAMVCSVCSQINRIQINWNLVRKETPQALPQTQESGAQQSVSISPSGSSDAHESQRTTGEGHYLANLFQTFFG